MDNVVMEEKKKRNKGEKKQRSGYIPKMDQHRFIVDVREEKESQDIINDLLSRANNKSYGRQIVFKDLVFCVLSRITDKDIEKLQEASLSEMERVERARADYNTKNSTNLTLGEFLVRKYNIN